MNRTRLSLKPLLAIFVLVTWGLTPLHAQEVPAAKPSVADGKPIRALLVTGGCCHDYPRQVQLITKGLEQRVGPIEWKVALYGSERDIQPDVYTDSNWAADYDIVVHNECFGAVLNGDFVERIVAGHVAAGVPGIAIHCSMHSYRAAPTADRWRALLGVTSVRHERGKRSLKVVPAVSEHPVMAGFPEAWQTPNGELYVIEKVWPTATVLATAYSEEEKVEMPVAWINEYQGVRMFGTTLGHHNETIADPVWMQMTAQGLQWALQREPAKPAR